MARPYGAGPDLGAYEWNGTYFYQDFHLGLLTPTDGSWRIPVRGPANRTLRLCVSNNLVDWLDIRTNATDSLRFVECTDDSALGWPTRFYRVISP